MQAQNDCADAIVVCGNADYSGLAAVGVGIQELNGHVTCQSAENNSIWLRLDISAPGTLTFTIKPTSPNIIIDYDFFVFGPNVTCGSIGQSIRCSTTNPQAASQSSNWTGLSASETDTSEGPGDDGNGFLKPLDVLAGETYFLVIDRPVGFSNFELQWGGTARFNDPPVIALDTPEALDLTKCDSDGIDDQSTAFDLTLNDSIVLADNPGMLVSYHVSVNDAITGADPIADPAHFPNTSNPQTVYARVRNPSSDCADHVPFTLLVENVITISPDAVQRCDDTADGDAANGLTAVDLQAMSVELLPAQDLSQYTVSYYLSEADYLGGGAPLSSPFTNTVPFEQRLFLRVTTVDGCRASSEVTLKIHPLPAETTVTLTQCDAAAQPDGKTLFELTKANADFTLGDPNLSVAYFASATDAHNGTAALTTFSNTTNPQQLVAKVTDTTTGCYRLNRLILIVSSNAMQEVTIPNCEDLQTEDGLTVTDITTHGVTVAAGETIAYYLSAEDALLEVNPIADPTQFTNTVPYQQKVYARIEGSGGCAELIAITVRIDRLPNIKVEDQTHVCLNDPDYVTIDAGLLEGLPSEFSYIWWKDDLALLRNTYALQVKEPGLYRVAVVNAFGCRKYRTVTVLPSNAAGIDGVTVADIATDDHTVTVTLSATSVGDYEFALDNGVFQPENVFENVSGGLHTVYVRDRNGCGMIERLITVLDVPKFFTPNADGAHDRWKVEASAQALNSATMLEIFTRDGKLLMTADPRNSGGWDGTYNGRPMPADDYWYIVHFNDGRIARGHFALKR